MASLSLLVLSDPAAGYLRLLDGLPPDTRVVAGNDPEMLREAGPRADVLVNCNQPRSLFKEVFRMAPRVRWVHSLSAGVENTLIPELAASSIPVTNSRGVFSRSLGEWAMSAVLYFAKDHRRLLRNQAAGRWEQFDPEEVHGKTMGIIGYGSIGQACARLAKPFGMHVVGLRSRPELSADDPCVERMLPSSSLLELMSMGDYIVVTAPLTPATRGLIGDAEVRAMRPTAVLINVGRGPVVQEKPLLEALRENRIRGAALDVFEKEPLAEGHPFYSLDNLLLSPHSADQVPGWTDSAMEFFVANFLRFHRGEPLENLVDKSLGY